MLKLSCARGRILATLTGLWLCVVAMPPAHSAGLLDNLNAERGVSAPSVLPAASRPHFYRQGAIVTCNVNSPTLGNNLCIMTFNRVAAHHLLQIDLIQCSASTTGGGILFNTVLQVDPGHVLGLISPNFGSKLETHGPFYLKAAERPKVLIIANAPSDTAFCTMSGTMWTTG